MSRAAAMSWECCRATDCAHGWTASAWSPAAARSALSLASRAVSMAGAERVSVGGGESSGRRDGGIAVAARAACPALTASAMSGATNPIGHLRIRPSSDGEGRDDAPKPPHRREVIGFLIFGGDDTKGPFSLAGARHPVRPQLGAASWLEADRRCGDADLARVGAGPVSLRGLHH